MNLLFLKPRSSAKSSFVLSCFNLFTSFSLIKKAYENSYVNDSKWIIPNRATDIAKKVFSADCILWFLKGILERTKRSRNIVVNTCEHTSQKSNHTHNNYSIIPTF